MASTVSTDMTANTAAESKPGFVKSYFRSGILGNLKVIVVITILHLISFPVALGMLTYDLRQEYLHKLALADPDVFYYSTSSTWEWFFGLAVLFTLVAVFAGIVIALNNFSYLYKKQNVDMYLSLPLKNSQRFLCDYFSGLAAYIVPFLTSGVITLMISAFSMNLVPDMAAEMAPGVYLSGFIIRCYLGAAAVMVMLYTLTVLVACVCGSFFETLFYTIVINGLIPGIIAIIVYVSLAGAFGLVYEDYIAPLLSKTSPLGAVIGFVMYADRYGDDMLSAGSFAKFILSILAVCALYTAGAYLLYKNRKAEDVSKPFVYNVFYYAIMFCIMLGMSAFAVLDDSVAPPLIFFMVVVYLIFEVVNKRGFKKFSLSLLRSVITIAACLGLSFTCKETKGFGISYRVPKADNVKSVTISYMGPEDIDSDHAITLSDPETIENVIAAHESIIEKYDKQGINSYNVYDSYFIGGRYVTLTYKLKNGTSLTREYKMTVDELYYLDMVCLDSSYESEILQVMEDAMPYDGIYISNIYNEDLHESIEPADRDLIDIENDKDYINTVKEIYAAYAKDLSSRTEQQLRNPDESPLVKIASTYYGEGSMYVYSWDKNVIDVLMSYGIDVYTLSDSLQQYNYYVDRGFPIDNIFCYDPGNNSERSITTRLISQDLDYYGSYDYKEANRVYGAKYSVEETQLAYELLVYAVPHYMTEEPLYKIVVDGEVFIIPPEYTDEAAQLYQVMDMSYREYYDRYADDYYDEYNGGYYYYDDYIDDYQYAE